MDMLFLLGRVLFGGFFVVNSITHFRRTKDIAAYAAMKKVPMPTAGVLISGLLLLSGGLKIILGVYTQYAVAEIILFLLPAAFLIHNFWKETNPQMQMTQKLFFMRNLALIGACLMILAIPMPWSNSIM